MIFGRLQRNIVLDIQIPSLANLNAGLSIIQFLIARIEQFLNSPIQFIDYMKLINSINNLRIEAICDQFASQSYIKFTVRSGRSIIQFLIRRIEQFLNSPIQSIDFIDLINSIRNLRIEAI